MQFFWRGSCSTFSLQLLLCSLIGLVQAAVITQRYDPNLQNRLTFDPRAQLFVHTCGVDKYIAASTTDPGDTISFLFKGTSIQFLAITDTDRGLYTITLDDQPVTTVSGVSASQACSPVFTQFGLPYTDHVLTIVSNNNTLAGGGVSAKIEFLAFMYGVPDDATTTGAPGAATTGSGNVSSVDSNGLSPGTIAGIAVSLALFVIAVVLGVMLFKVHHQRAQTTKPAPVQPGVGLSYTGGAEPMAIIDDRALHHSPGHNIQHMTLSHPSLGAQQGMVLGHENRGSMGSINPTGSIRSIPFQPIAGPSGAPRTP